MTRYEDPADGMLNVTIESDTSGFVQPRLTKHEYDRIVAKWIEKYGRPSWRVRLRRPLWFAVTFIAGANFGVWTCIVIAKIV